jgi:hypothetical protein
MRTFIFILIPALALAACNVSHNDANDSTTLSYNQDLAENAIDDASNTAGNIADDIGNDVDRAGDKIENKVGDVDVNVDIHDDDQATATTNSN